MYSFLKKMVYGCLLFISLITLKNMNVLENFSLKIQNYNDHLFLPQCVDMEDINTDDSIINSELYALLPPVTDSGNAINTNFSMQNYFMNLKNNLPKNVKGSCGYISLISVLSYYDTFYNDDIIHERYERKNVDATTLEEAISESPGVEQGIYDIGVSNALYIDYIRENYNTDFLCGLIKANSDIKNGDKADYEFETHDTSSEFATEIKCYDSILYSFYGNYNIYCEAYCLENLEATETEKQAIYFNYIKTNISQGKPVILHIHSTSTEARHSVVAYAFDENNIYCHYGYNSEGQYLPVFSYNYNRIYYAATINIDMIENHSNNYIINGIDYCGCNSHIHNLTYTSYGSGGHSEYCSICQYRENFVHSIHSNTSLGNNCIYCNYEVNRELDIYNLVD